VIGIDPEMNGIANRPFRRLAIVSHTFPPVLNGQATMLARVLGNRTPESYVQIATRECKEPRSDLRLRGRMLMITERRRRSIPRIPGFQRWLLRADLLAEVRLRRRLLERIVRQERCDGILACTGDPVDLPAAWNVARRLGIPLVPYYFDWYAHQFDAIGQTGSEGRQLMDLARSSEPEILRDAATIIVPNEFLQAELKRLYRRDSCLVRNPTGFSLESAALVQPWPSHSPVQIVYTGSVYAAHFDAFRSLLAGMEKLKNLCTLRIYTDQDADDLKSNGLCGPIDFRPQVPPSEVEHIQKSADILFLPLAFQSPFPEVIRTSAPGKIGDYLASGRPVLVHAPADTFTAWYFRKHACGVVADCRDPDTVVHALKQIIEDAALRRAVCDSAFARARADFSITHAQAALDACLASAASSAQGPAMY
jgi:glycosyltransferase involved in cell wall biosynthesis